MNKMKKIIKTVLLFLLIFLFTKLVIYIATTNKKVEYDVVGKIDFHVVEEYSKQTNYSIEISYKKYKFRFINDTNYHKKMKIIKNIEYLKNEDVFCVYPIFENYTSSEMLCNKEGKYYSYYSLREDSSVRKFVHTLEKKGYTFESYSESDKYEEYNHIKVFRNNQPKNSKIVLWNYTGIDIIGKKYSTFHLSDKDIYNNKLWVLVDNYFLSPSYENEFSFDKMIEINLVKEKKKEIKLDKDISFDSYINGIHDDFIYIMDKDHLLQYTYNYKKHILLETGNKENNGIYYRNNKKEVINIYDLAKKELFFTNDIQLKEMDKLFSIKEKYKYLNRYYFITEDNSVYSLYEEDLSRPIFLFKMDDIREVELIGDSIYFIKGDSIYLYNRYSGLKKVLSKNELKYNFDNIYDVYIYD